MTIYSNAAEQANMTTVNNLATTHEAVFPLNMLNELHD
jgi:hypothetical protein